ncbi:hypothetical protein [Rufibacter radiotolerans]|uniref:hypothetical protein n=1 Tax=Rufibacter radiotolerans TaxID=1379910 RepID=UPI0006645841|nr:hypothetical protein [Rufibacter radiotolerans]
MGAWDTLIKGNDTCLDIYSAFYDRYNQGESPSAISKVIFADYQGMFEDEDDRNNSLFALAFAQWETKSLDPTIYSRVRDIIEGEQDLQVWKNLGADAKTIEKRRKTLHKFLEQISTEKDKPKRRVKPKFEFETKDLVNSLSPDSNKAIRISEEYTNKNYIHTSGLIMWENGGGAILYFTGHGMEISASWLDSQTLEVTHQNEIQFGMKNEKAFFCGDEVKIIYKGK